jgi:flavin-dependent dehydrogenase
LSYDVIVAGAGPAGCVAARRLALSGAKVALIAGRTTAGAEGISRRSLEILREEILLVDSAADRSVHCNTVAGPFRRTGTWGDDRHVVGTEWLLDRQWLALTLREAAAGAGVDVRDGTAISVVRGQGGVRVETREPARFLGRFLVDARGRRGPQRCRGPALLAIGQRFRGRSAETHTVIHPLHDGWCWYAADPLGVYVQLVGRPRRRYRKWLEHARAQIPALDELLKDATPIGSWVARPAHARLARASDAAWAWRVGDAALAHDPLSGQGIYEAVRSARVVATAVISVLEGGDAVLARRFVADRQAETWRHSVSLASEFYGENRHYGPFWSEVTESYRALVAPRAIQTPHIETRPVIERERIRERDVLVTMERPQGVWQIDGVPVIELMDYCQSVKLPTVADAAASVAREPAAVATALRWLWSAGALAASPIASELFA